MVLAKSKNFKHGNVSAQSMGGSAHNIVSSTIVKPKISFHISTEKLLDSSIKIPRVNPQKNVEEFDKITGINSNSPEIVSFSNFIPVYDKNGELNEFGDYLKKKQDAYLIRAAANISNFLSNKNIEVLKTRTESNAKIVTEFCEEHSKGINDLLSHFSLIKQRMDFRNDIDKNTLRMIGVTTPNSILNSIENPDFYTDESVLTIEEVLNENNKTIANWTPTKIWIQSCNELKEILKNGMVQTFLCEGSLLGVDPTNYSYYDAYSLTPARNSFVKKFNFNERQVSAPPLNELIRTDPGSLDSILRSIIVLFSAGGRSIFNDAIFSDMSHIEESIAKLSHVLCKEYVYSTKMRSSIVSEYGYPFVLGGKNTRIWDYLIGKSGADITDINRAPYGGGKSLISISQSFEPDNVEVLSFEDRYMNDDVGTVRPEVVITPGSVYYLESSINISNTVGFDLSRVNRYLTKLNSATSLLKMIKEDLMFSPEVPYSSVANKVLNKLESNLDTKGRVHPHTFQEISSTYGESTTATIALSSPISLLRHLEQEILNNSGLLKREGGPKLWTSKNFNNLEQDVSALLISLAIDRDDAELQSLLFLHQIYSFSDSRSGLTERNFTTSTSTADSTNKAAIAYLIVERIKKLFDHDRKDASVKENDDFTVSLSVITNALISSKNSQSLRILNKIGSQILYFDENFDVNNSNFRTNGKFFVEQTKRALDRENNRNAIGYGNPSTDLVSSYSGIQKTVFLSGIFKLCCLLVHAANPERIVSIRKPNKKTQGSSSLVISKIRNAVVGTILDSEKSKQGNTSFNLPEDDSEGNGLFNLSNKFEDMIFGKKSGPKKIKIFELPKSSQNGVKVFGAPTPPNSNISQKAITKKFTMLSILYYDDVMVKVENMLADYDIKIKKYVDRFYGFIYTLKEEYFNLKNNLQTNRSYGRSLFLISNTIGDFNLTKQVMSEEQLLLVKSAMEDCVSRLDLDSYISPIRDSIPHFSSLSDETHVENFLPIEDVHLVSWNLMLKDFLKVGKYFDGSGSNKKIISVGLPRKLHRKMRVNSSRLSGLIHRNSLIQVCIYRVNAFLPDVIYKPLVYNFDMKLFPTRILKNYKDSGFSVFESEGVAIRKGILDADDLCTTGQGGESYLDPNNTARISDRITDLIPLRKESLDSKSTLIIPSNKGILKENDYSFLSEQQFNEIYRNHTTSFLLEEYLRFVSDLPFDENKYKQYKDVKQKVRTPAVRFVSEYIDIDRFFNKTFENLYNDENLLTNPSTTVRSLVLPKKFDRVFHIIFDPDDFEIDQKTPIEVIQKYTKGNKDINSLIKNETNEPTFDKYYVVLRSNEGSDAT